MSSKVSGYIIGYLTVGAAIAARAYPHDARKFVLTALLWPVPMAAEATKRLIGHYPSWSPQLKDNSQ